MEHTHPPPGKVALAVALIMVGCCSNVVALELIVKRDAGCGNIVTLLQFIFVAILALPSQVVWPHGALPTLRPRSIPLRFYALLVAIFFVVSVLNNKALDYEIALPFHMVFRSGSLITSLVLGVVVLRKRYSTSQYVGIASVTTGILITTLASAQALPSVVDMGPHGTKGLFVWLTGIGMLVTAMILSSLLGILQESAYTRWGKAWQENLFYAHALSIPFFLVVGPDIIAHARIWNEATDPLWIFALANVITQYVCIRGVYTLTGLTSSLTTTLVITLRKFISLVFSVVYFQNPFTLTHWLGTFLVFGGSLLRNHDNECNNKCCYAVNQCYQNKWSSTKEG